MFDDALADDVAQDVWVAALEHGPRETSSLRAWLAALARNLAWKSRRGDRRRAAREEAVARPEAVPSAAEILERESVRRRVIEAVLALEEPYRSTIVLRYFEGLEPREVARRLEIPVETVRTREKRARELLRTRLDREHGGDGDGRLAWSLALVRELRLDAPPWHALPIIAKSILSGGFIMSTVKIAAGAAALVLVLVGTLAWLEARHRTEDRPAERVAAKADLAPAPAAKPQAVGSERVGLATAGDSAIAGSAEARGALHIRALWSDHTPAADVTLNADDEQIRDEFRWIDAITGPDGTCTLEHLRPGKIFVRASPRPFVDQKREGEPVEIEPGRMAELELTIAPGIDVDGDVVDERGEGVSDAVVLLAQDQTGWFSRPIARTDANGAFRIRAAPPGACLCAYRAGRFPSLRPRLQASIGGETEIRLVLPGIGGDLEGIVTDASGTPIPDAKILVGFEDYHDVRFVEGKTVYGPARRRATTDERGHYRVEGLAPGSSVISARAPGFAQWKGTVEVQAGGMTRNDVRLPQQVIVEGSVRDGDGKPLAGAIVGLEGPETFLWVLRKTAENGSFRLTGLPVGDFHLKATVRGLGGAEVDLHGAASDILHWDAVVSSGRTIAGRVVGPLSELGSVVVEGRPTKLGRSALGHLEADGRFRMTELEDQPYDVVAVLGSNHVPLASQLAVSPGGPEVVLEIDRAKLPSSRVRGRLMDAEGRPVDAEIQLRLRDMNRFPTGAVGRSESGTGRFEIAQLVAGNWDLEIDAQGLVHRSFPGHALAAEETWDLGDVELSRGGVLVIVPRMEDGSKPPPEPLDTTGLPPRYFVATLTTDPNADVTMQGDQARSGPLPAGSHVLSVHGSLDPPIAGMTVPFEIVAGQETRLDVVLRAGKRVTVAIADPTANAVDVQAFVTTKDGTYIGYSPCEVHEGRNVAAFRLLDGEYGVHAMAKDGRKSDATITVTAGGPDSFELELKRP